MNCPTCKKELPPVKPGERSYFPFCCERCKLIDLGRWFDGKYQIPVRETDRDNATPDDPPRRSDADID